MVKSKKCYIALLLFSTMFLGLFVNSSGDASALEDYVLTFDNSTSINTNAFSVDITNYNYIYISSTGDFPYTDVSGPPPLRIFGFSNGCQSGYYYYTYTLQSKINHASTCPGYLYKEQFRLSNATFSNIPSNESVTVILSENPVIGSSSPSGTLSISENGTFNVSSYEYAEVDVPAPPVVTPYDGKLDSLIQAVYTVGAVMLVIYFFFALYRLYIGGKT